MMVEMSFKYEERMNWAFMDDNCNLERYVWSRKEIEKLRKGCEKLTGIPGGAKGQLPSRRRGTISSDQCRIVFLKCVYRTYSLIGTEV